MLHGPKINRRIFSGIDGGGDHACRRCGRKFRRAKSIVIRRPPLQNRCARSAWAHDAGKKKRHRCAAFGLARRKSWKEASFRPPRRPRCWPLAIGQIGSPGDTVGTTRANTDWYRSGAETAELVNAIQRYLVEHTRLGIPALFPRGDGARAQGA